VCESSNFLVVLWWVISCICMLLMEIEGDVNDIESHGDTKKSITPPGRPSETSLKLAEHLFAEFSPNTCSLNFRRTLVR
jgi:hypothetical protein